VLQNSEGLGARISTERSRFAAEMSAELDSFGAGTQQNPADPVVVKLQTHTGDPAVKLQTHTADPTLKLQTHTADPAVKLQTHTQQMLR